MRPTVLLDLYGTLVEPDWAELLKGRTALAERAGLDAPAARRAWDMTHIARMTGTYGLLADDLAAIFSEASQGTWAATSAGLLPELADAELENWSHGVSLYPDAVPALSLLRSSGLRLAIVTNASAEAASVVDTLGLRALVDDVFVSCEAGMLKPELLAMALRRLRADPHDTTLVDDEPAQLDEAARLSIGTILIRRSGGPSGTTAAAAHDSLTDLRQVADLVVRAGPARPR